MFLLKAALTILLFVLAIANSFFVGSFVLVASGYAVIAAGLFILKGIPAEHSRISAGWMNRFYDLFIGALVFGAGWFGLADNLQNRIGEELRTLEAAGGTTAPLGEIDVAFAIAIVATLVFVVGFLVLVVGLFKDYRDGT